MIDEIKAEQENSNCPFLNWNTPFFNWKTEHVHEIKPLINVSFMILVFKEHYFHMGTGVMVLCTLVKNIIYPQISRQEEKGCGTIVEIYPWAILVNTSGQQVMLNISDEIYTIDSCEIVVPPNIEVRTCNALHSRANFLDTK